MSDLQLVIDDNDTYVGEKGAFYLRPERLPLVEHLKQSTFSSAFIQTEQIDLLTPTSMNFILKALKVEGVLEVVVVNDISSMHESDSKRIISVAKLVGFYNFKTTKTEYTSQDKKYTSLLITCAKPEKHPNEVEYEIKISTKTEPKSKIDISQLTTKSVTTTTYSQKSKK